MMELKLTKEFQQLWVGRDPFQAVQQITGKVYREKEGRTTLRFELGGRSYFLKVHRGIGWKEIVKNLTQLRLPVLGASNEYQASLALHNLGVATLNPVAYGKRGWNPAKQLSFIITEDLVDTISLEDFCRDWSSNPPEFNLKLALIKKLAKVSKRMHDAGINHRDYYICHFLLDPKTVGVNPQESSIICSLIDLHRAQQRRSLPERWRIKDIAGIFYSAMDTGLTRRDLLRFMVLYSGKSLRQTLATDLQFWRQVRKRAEKLYQKDMGREAPRWL